MSASRLVLPGSVIAVLCLSTSVAFAQWRNPYTGITWNNPGSSLIDTMLHGKLMEKVMAGARVDIDRSAGEKMAGADGRAVRITYRPGKSRVAEEVAASVFDDKDRQAELAQYLREALASYSREAAKVGRKDDLGFALTFFVAGNYAVMNEQDVPDAVTVALNRQMDGALGSIDAIRKSGDRLRQKLAEHLVCATALALAGYQQGKANGDTEQVARFRQLAGQYLNVVLSVDPSRVSLSDAGVSRK